MLKASIDVTVTTSTSAQHSDPYNFWTVKLVMKTGEKITRITEQDFYKGSFDKDEAANEALHFQSDYFLLVFGDS